MNNVFRYFCLHFFGRAIGLIFCSVAVMTYGCGGGSDDDSQSEVRLNGIVINSTTLQKGLPGCKLVVNATNTTNQRKSALLFYEALGSDGRSIGWNLIQGFFIPPNSTANSPTNYVQNSFIANDNSLMPDCSQIHSVRLSPGQSVVM